MKNPANTVCNQCPWLKANQGRRTPTGLYSHKALITLWNKLRRGTGQHICPVMTEASAIRHNTNPPPQVECPASIALIYREIANLYRLTKPDKKVTHSNFGRYTAQNPLGLTRAGLTHWTLVRPKLPPHLGGNPIPPIPKILVQDLNLISKPDE